MAYAITKSATLPDAGERKVKSLDDDDEFPEGKVLTRLHKSRERNPTAVKKKKAKTLAETGKLLCEVCDFDFAAFYGQLGEGFAECHHIAPLHTLPERKSVTLKDLAIVCANCHRMLHRGRGVRTTDDLRAVAQGRRPQV